MGLSGSLFVLMCPYESLCVYMDSNVSLWFFMGLYAFLWVRMCAYSFFCVFMDFKGSLGSL